MRQARRRADAVGSDLACKVGTIVALTAILLCLGGCRAIENVTAIFTDEKNPWNTEVTIPNVWGDAVDEDRDHDSEWAPVAQAFATLPLALIDNVWGFLGVAGTQAAGGPVALRDINMRAAITMRSMGSLKKATILRNAADGDDAQAKGGAKIVLEFHEPPAADPVEAGEGDGHE